MYQSVGRTNVGKSTLLNLLVGEKIAAITNKVQTTRTQIKGIVNRENSQIIFIDTPGIHKPKTKLNENMVELSWDALQNCDVILFLIEADSEEIGRGDTKILEKIKEAHKKCILIINKIDLVQKEKLAQIIDLYKNQYDFSAIIPIFPSYPICLMIDLIFLYSSISLIYGMITPKFLYFSYTSFIIKHSCLNVSI